MVPSKTITTLQTVVKTGRLIKAEDKERSMGIVGTLGVFQAKLLAELSKFIVQLLIILILLGQFLQKWSLHRV